MQCRLSVISRMESSRVNRLIPGGKQSLSKRVRLRTDEEKRVTSLCEGEECRRTCKLSTSYITPSNQEDARGLSERMRRERERDGDEKQKSAEPCAWMMTKNRCRPSFEGEIMCTDFMQKVNLLHPPPVRTKGGDARRGPTSSQREGAQLPVDPANVCRRWRPLLSAFPRRRHHRRCDGA